MKFLVKRSMKTYIAQPLLVNFEKCRFMTQFTIVSLNELKNNWTWFLLMNYMNSCWHLFNENFFDVVHIVQRESLVKNNIFRCLHNWVFHKLDEIENIAIIGIRGFTT